MLKGKRTGLLLALLILITAGVFFWISYNNQQVRSEKDLYMLTDRFRDYNWSDNGNGSKLTFKLLSYKEKFQISPAFLPGLNKEAFISINLGDTVTIGIPAYAQQFLNTRQKRIPVYSIRVNNKTYLDAGYTIKKKNSNALMIAGSLVLLAGLVVYFTKRRSEVVSR